MSLDHQLTIETPEQIHLEFHIAGIGSRFLAFFVDTIVQGLSVMIVLLVLIFAFPSFDAFFGRAGSNWLIALWIVFWFLLYWGYFAFFEAVWKGQTPGKRTIGIRVVKDSGRAINTFEAISRNFLRAVDQLPGIYVFGLISMIISKENRRIGDYVAGTLVVHDRSEDDLDPLLQNLSTPDRGLKSVDTSKLAASDLQLIEGFLHRRLSFDSAVREQTALRIVTFIQEKSGLAPEPGQSLEDFLETVARSIRDRR